MTKFILSIAIAVTALFAVVEPAEAGCCEKQTVEVCRRCFTKTKCVCGCVKTIRYIEVTYCTTDCCGRKKVFKKVYRA